MNIKIISGILPATLMMAGLGCALLASEKGTAAAGKEAFEPARK
jgi:hypothetical protein